MKLCHDFREVGNDGKKSYVLIKPVCADCFKALGFPLTEKELGKEMK